MAAKKINLLPKDLTVSKDVQDVAVKLTQFSYFAIFIFILTIAIGASAFFYFSNKLKNLTTTQNTLTSNIQGLQETEEQIILTKDKVAKIKSILDARTNEQTFKKHKTVVDNLPETISVTESEIDSSNSEISFDAKDCRDLVSFMSSLLAQSNTLNIVMGNLSFNPFQGYSLTLEIF